MSKLTLSPAAQRRLGYWLLNGDTGTSSETMAAIALGATKVKNCEVDAPYDEADFGRCYRLVKKVPEIRDHFPRIAKHVKVFAGILHEWDALVRIYERDKPKGESPELYNRIRELRGDRV